MRFAVAWTSLLLFAAAACVANVDDGPEILDFRAERELVQTADAVFLSWDVRGAEALRLEAGGDIEASGLPAKGSTTVHPEWTTTYRLVAVAGDREVSASRLIRVNAAPPVIRWFRSDDPTARIGETSRLSWRVERASSVRLYDALGEVDWSETGPGSGEAKVSPVGSTTYTLLARNGAGEVRGQLVLGVERGPLVAFWSEGSKVSLGEEAVLRWEVSGADSILLLEGSRQLAAGLPSSGQWRLRPDRSQRYLLVAKSAGVERVAELRIDVAPIIESFRLVEAGPHRAGQMVTARWRTQGADELSVETEDGAWWARPEELAAGSARIRVPRRGPVVLRATRDLVSAERRVEPLRTEGPRIVDLRVSPEEATLPPGGSLQVTVEWEVDGATELELEASPGGRVDIAQHGVGPQSVAVVVSGSTLFRLTAKNPKGSEVRHAALHVLPTESAPAIRDLHVHPLLTLPGGALEVNWEATGVRTARLCTASACPCVAEGEAARRGSCLLRAPEAAGSVPLTLEVEGQDGEARTETVVATVVEGVGIPWVRAKPLPNFVDTEAGLEAEIQWEAKNGERIEIHELEADGSVGSRLLSGSVDETAQGSIPVLPTLPPVGRYRVTLFNPLGWPSHADVEVRVDPATIEEVVADPTVPPGGAAALQWRSVRSRQVLLERSAIDGRGRGPWVAADGPEAQVVPLEDGIGMVELGEGFSFPWGGERHRVAWVSAYGTLSFGAIDHHPTGEPRRLPTVLAEGVHLAAFWDDLDPKETGVVVAERKEDEEGPYVLVEWRNFQFAESSAEEPADLNFQVLLRESGAFEFRYGEMRSEGEGELTGQARADGARASIGYQVGETGRNLSFRRVRDGGLGGSFWSAGTVELEPEGALQLRPYGATRYRLVASNPHSSDEAEWEIHVTP